MRGARTHNLKNIDLDLPRHRLIVITGLSGSGKSSLAFDTLYAEGQRRYVESLSAYARQFLQLMEKPDVDLIEGLSPAISIEQRSASHNPRSTVGTVTEIHDYLRLLFARVGTPYCPIHKLPLQSQSVSQMVDTTLRLPADTRVMVMAPVIRERKGEFAEFFDDMQTQGFVRFRIDGAIVEADALPPLKKAEKHSLDVVVDRLKVRADAQQRLAESFETALRLADGRALLLDLDDGRETLFSSRFACPECDYSLSELEPRLFSFNNPMGACEACDGLGQVDYFDESRVVAHPELSLASGAIKGWDARNQYYFQMLATLAQHYGFDIDAPFGELPKTAQDVVLNGSGETEIAFAYTNERGRKMVRRHPFEGVIPNLQRRFRETDSSVVREELGKLRSRRACPVCEGTRLRREARNVFIGEGATRRGIYQIAAAPLREAFEYFERLNFTGSKKEIASKIVKEIGSRLRFLVNVGLDYLSLDRSAETLSGGESQRIRLASQIGSGLTGVMYVLDEPSIGLHQRDNGRLIDTLKHLRDFGNTVIVVEHDEDAIRAADYMVDMGLGAGVHGGEVIAQGELDEVLDDPNSLTGQYLSGRRQIEIPNDRTPPFTTWLKITGAHGNNLKERDARNSRRAVDVCDRRLGLGQVDADQRHAVRGGRTPSVWLVGRAGAVRFDRRARKFRQGHQRRSERDRPHAALEPGHLYGTVHADSRAVRRNADRARARLRSRPVFVQRQGRALRNVPGRRRHQGRDALSARCVRAVRYLPWQALQPRNTRSALQRQKHRRCARPDGRRRV